eukprot:1147629-Pelagomonas_calceolata.AAC.2
MHPLLQAQSAAGPVKAEVQIHLGTGCLSYSINHTGISKLTPPGTHRVQDKTVREEAGSLRCFNVAAMVADIRDI